MKQQKFWTTLFFLLFIPATVLATDNFAATKHLGKYPTYPKINYKQYTKKKAALIKRGAYLTKLGDCIACHTKPGSGKTFAGGLAIKTPFGTLYTPNITPDKTTGIGGWTTQQFIKVMHKGKSPQEKYYYPAFPYLYFNSITTKDLVAIKAYLDVIPAIQQENQKNDMMFPFSWRFMQLGWRILFFRDKGDYKYNPKHTAVWNRGKYLVDGLGHCGMCHTPMHHILVHGVHTQFEYGRPIFHIPNDGRATRTSGVTAHAILIVDFLTRV